MVEIDEPHAVVSIEGKGGRVPKTKASVDVGSAGTAARFLTAYLGLCEGEYHMNSSEQMKKRPMEELLQALQDLGAEVTYKEASGHFPFAIGNSGVNRHEVTIDVEKSSQFLSALLISSVLFQKEFRIHVKGHHGMAYVEMTVAMMKQFGVEVQRPASDTFVIAEHAAYQAREYQIEPDVSAASYFYAMCPVVGVPAKVCHVHWESLQGDTSFLHVLEQMGCRTEEEPDGIRMYPPTEGFLGGVFDFSAFSDQALTLAAIACFASETPRLWRNVRCLRAQSRASVPRAALCAAEGRQTAAHRPRRDRVHLGFFRLSDRCRHRKNVPVYAHLRADLPAALHLGVYVLSAVRLRRGLG